MGYRSYNERSERRIKEENMVVVNYGNAPTIYGEFVHKSTSMMRMRGTMCPYLV